MSLSEIKFEHTDGVIRRELVSGECAPQPERPAVPAHPYWGQLKVVIFCTLETVSKLGVLCGTTLLAARRLSEINVVSFEC